MTKYTFTTGNGQAVDVEAETIEQAYEIIKAEYGCYLKVIGRKRLKR